MSKFLPLAAFALITLACMEPVLLAPTPTEAPAALATTPTPIPRQSPTAQDTCTVSTGVPAGYLNLRAGPGMEYAVLRVLNEGEVLTIVTPGAWHEVTDAEGNTGYVNSTYCKG